MWHPGGTAHEPCAPGGNSGQQATTRSRGLGTQDELATRAGCSPGTCPPDGRERQVHREGPGRQTLPATAEPTETEVAVGSGRTDPGTRSRAPGQDSGLSGAVRRCCLCGSDKGERGDVRPQLWSSQDSADLTLCEALGHRGKSDNLGLNLGCCAVPRMSPASESGVLICKRGSQGPPRGITGRVQWNKKGSLGHSLQPEIGAREAWPAVLLCVPIHPAPGRTATGLRGIAEQSWQ